MMGLRVTSALSMAIVGNIWMFPKIGFFTPNHPFVHRVFHCKPSILGGFLVFLETPIW